MTDRQPLGSAILHLFYPHICAGCGDDRLPRQSHLCMHCLHRLPITEFEKHADNPVEKLLAGRLLLASGAAYCYYSKKSKFQRILHQFKYQGNKSLGLQLGQMMGRALLDSGRFQSLEGLIPLPLYSRRLIQRGFNQAEVLCQGLAHVLHLPVYNRVVIRQKQTETQTLKDRVHRWQNMHQIFQLREEGAAQNRHMLLVDDILTTGATMEACGSVLQQIPGIKLSVAILGFTKD